MDRLMRRCEELGARADVRFDTANDLEVAGDPDAAWRMRGIAERLAVKALNAWRKHLLRQFRAQQAAGRHRRRRPA